MLKLTKLFFLAVLYAGCAQDRYQSSSQALSATLGVVSSLVDVGGGAVESSGRQVVKDGNNLYVAVIDPLLTGQTGYRNSSQALRVYRSGDSGVTWVEQDVAHRPTVGPGQFLGGADVAVDAVNHVLHIAWLNGQLGKAIYQTFSTTTNLFGPMEQLTLNIYVGDTGNNLVSISLVAGGPLVALADQNGIRVWRRTGANAWALDGTLSTTYSLHPSLQTDALGQAHVAWLDGNPFSGSAPTIKYSRRAAGGGWGATELVANPVMLNTNQDQSPSLAVDSNNYPHVTYLTGAAASYSDPTSSQLRVAYRDSTGWHQDDPTGYAHNPSICMVGADSYVFKGHNYNIFPSYVTRAAGSTWSADTTVSSVPHDGSASCWVEPGSTPTCGKIHVLYHDEASTIRTGVAHAETFYASVSIGNCGAPQPDMSVRPDLSVVRDLSTAPDLLLPMCNLTLCRCQ